VNESRGIREEEPRLIERNTVDVEAWAVLPDTRLFAAEAVQTVRKGRRPFAEILNSQIEQAMGHF
jgi:hypothetical protein